MVGSLLSIAAGGGRVALRIVQWAALSAAVAAGIHWGVFGFLWWEPTHWAWAAQHWRAGTIDQVYLAVFPAAAIASWLLLKLPIVRRTEQRLVALPGRLRDRRKARLAQKAGALREAVVTGNASLAPFTDPFPAPAERPIPVEPPAAAGAPVSPGTEHPVHDEDPVDTDANPADRGEPLDTPLIPPADTPVPPPSVPSRGDETVGRLEALYRGGTPEPQPAMTPQETSRGSSPAPVSPAPQTDPETKGHAAKAGDAFNAILAGRPVDPAGEGTKGGKGQPPLEAVVLFLGTAGFLPVRVPGPVEAGRIGLYALDGERLLAFSVLEPGLDGPALSDALARCRRSRGNCIGTLTNNLFIDPDNDEESVATGFFLVSENPIPDPHPPGVTILVLPRPIPGPQDQLEAWEDWPDRIGPSDGLPPPADILAFVEETLIAV